MCSQERCKKPISSPVVLLIIKWSVCTRAGTALEEYCAGKLRDLWCRTSVEVSVVVCSMLVWGCPVWWLNSTFMRHGEYMRLCTWSCDLLPSFCYSLPGFSLKRLLAWLIYQLCYGLGMSLGPQNWFCRDSFFFSTIFLVYFPQTDCYYFSMGGSSCCSSVTNVCCFRRVT